MESMPLFKKVVFVCARLEIVIFSDPGACGPPAGWETFFEALGVLKAGGGKASVFGNSFFQALQPVGACGNPRYSIRSTGR